MKDFAARILMLPEGHPSATLFSVGALFLLLYTASLVFLPKSNGRIVIGDATHHYVQLRSAVFDRDLQFRNEYETLYRLRGDEPGLEWVYEPTATGHVRNLMPVGPALLWAPAYLLVVAGVWLTGLFGVHYPLDGYGRLFQATAGISGIVAATLGSWLTYRAAARLLDSRVAIWATLSVWLSSSAVYYSLVSPTYSHAASLFAVSAFWATWILMDEQKDLVRYGLLGVLVGVAGLMRWQDLVLVLVPTLEIAARLRDAGVRTTLSRLLAVAVGALIGFLPQMIVWNVLYGAPLTIPQGPGFMRWSQPALLAVLISDNHGLLSWTPIVALSLVGLWWLWRRAPLVGGAAVLFFAVSWYVNAAVADWWAGEAFGARRFVSCFPVFVFGLAALLSRARRASIAGAAVFYIFSFHTLLLFIQYQAFMRGLRQIVPYPSGLDGLYLARFRAPIDLLHWWLSSR
jgi:hypothetical protein